MQFFSDLRRANTTRQDEWDPEGFANNEDWRVNELGGELGEALNVMKKLHRERCGVPGSRATKEQLAEELADVVICTDLLAHQFGFGPLEIRPANNDDFPGLTQAGRFLFALAGRLAVPGAADKVLLNLVASVVFSIAEVEGIVLAEAVRKKFNATSRKVGLATLMEE